MRRLIQRRTIMKCAASGAALLLSLISTALAQDDLESVGPMESLESAEELSALALWIPQFTVRAGGGYNDNITLSPVAPEASAFLSFGVDGILSG